MVYCTNACTLLLRCAMTSGNDDVWIVARQIAALRQKYWKPSANSFHNIVIHSQILLFITYRYLSVDISFSKIPF